MADASPMSARGYHSQLRFDHASSSAPPQGASASASATTVPNILQPGGMASRPHPMSSNTTPSLPTSMHPSMQPPQHAIQQHQQQQHSPMQEYPPSGKPPLNLSHNYSRSSPAAGYDAAAASSSSYHAYTPTTPGGSSSQFASTPDATKYGAPGSQRNISNTPLGLADIRPRADSSMSDGSPSGMAYEVANAQPGPSNYLAPWAVYAFDWCKWRPQGNSAGKIAVGSYLEDGHNFVRIILGGGCTPVIEANAYRFKFSIPTSFQPLKKYILLELPNTASSLQSSPRPPTPTQ